MNVDRGNLARVDELLADLAARGVVGKVTVVPARMTSIVANPAAPVATYSGSCFSSAEFADEEIAFERLAMRHGFSPRPTPRAIGTPCTAVRASEVVVGPDGELWKCWDDIGDASAAIGSIFDYHAVDAHGVGQWLAYDPFGDDQCRACVALPSCMGGSAHHQFHSDDPSERCGSFRFNHRERVRLHGQRLLGLAADEAGSVARPVSASVSAPVAVPVTLSTARR